jgi:hypothetical protein
MGSNATSHELPEVVVVTTPDTAAEPRPDLSLSGEDGRIAVEEDSKLSAK